MDPVAALEEIAFLLERDRASRYKSTAFRRAAAIIEEYTPEELAARVRDGRLKRTKGIGDSTYAVIAQAVGGEVPTYLADLRERSGPAVSSAKVGLRAQRQYDVASAARLLLRAVALLPPGDREVFVGPDGPRIGRAILAGSTLTMNQAVANPIAWTGASEEQALACASVNPARLIGLDPTESR